MSNKSRYTIYDSETSVLSPHYSVLAATDSVLSPQSSSLLLDLTADLLTRGQTVRFRATGQSMHPTIRDGEIITVEPVAASQIKQGDILLYQRADCVIAHRVVSVIRAGERPQSSSLITFVTRGDASTSSDDPVNGQQILGKVVFVTRGDHFIDLTSRRVKILRAVRVAAHYFKERAYTAVRNVHNIHTSNRPMTLLWLPFLVWLILSLFQPAKIFAQGIGFDNSTSANSGANAQNSLTFSHTVNSNTNGLLIVGVSLNNSGSAIPSVSTVTYNGVSLTSVGRHCNTNASPTNGCVEIWRLLAPATGAHNVVITLSAANTAFVVGGSASFTGVNQTTPVGTFFGADGSSATPSVNVTSVNEGEVVIDTIANKNANAGLTATATAGQTERWNNKTTSGTANDNTIGAGSTKPGPAGGGTVTMSWTYSASKNWAIAAAAIKPVNATAVKLMSFAATTHDGQSALLQWRSGYEVDNLGFHVYREEAGQRIRLTPDLIAGSALLAGAGTHLTSGHSYRWLDDSVMHQRSAVSGQRSDTTYWLEDIDINGKRTWHGPVHVQPSTDSSNNVGAAWTRSMLLGDLGRPDEQRSEVRDQRSEVRSQRPAVGGQRSAVSGQQSALTAQSSVLSPQSSSVDPQSSILNPRSSTSLRTQSSSLSPQSSVLSAQSSLLSPQSSIARRAVQLSSNRNLAWQWLLAAGRALKISVREEGWYRIGQSQLVAAGLDRRVDPRTLQLFVDGHEVPITVTGEQDGRLDASDAIQFYGVGLDTPSTDTRVYWLVWGREWGKRIKLDNNDATASGIRTFPSTVERKDRTVYFAALKNGDAENFFGPVVANDPVQQTLTLPYVASLPGAAALLEVKLQGVTTDRHQVRLWLNNVQVGALDFAGQVSGSVQLAVSQSLLLEGDNVVTLVAEGGATDVSLIDSIRLTYQHSFIADGDELRFSASAGQPIVIKGFSSSQIRVFDITDADAVHEMKASVGGAPSNYAVMVVPAGTGNRLLLAVTEKSARAPLAIESNRPSTWHQASHGADLVIIAHKDFLGSVESLKALRQGQGLSVAVIDVDDLYDEFSFGHKTPQALRDFLSRSRAHWRKAPRFALLVGDATFDPRNYLGLGNFDLVPTKLIDTTLLETASDDWFADFNNTGVPQLAVGRLPVRTAEEADTVIAKITGYRQDSSRQALFVADVNDVFDFQTLTEDVADALPADIAVHGIFRGQTDDATTRNQLLHNLNLGQLLVNYAGHGSVEVWRGGLLSSDDARSLTNGSQLSLFLIMNCLNGFFQDLYTESLAEALIKAPQGGAVAVWASSGLTDPAGQAVMDQALVPLLFQGLTLGEAAVRAKQSVTDEDVRRTWILFGDPTTRLR